MILVGRNAPYRVETQDNQRGGYQIRARPKGSCAEGSGKAHLGRSLTIRKSDEAGKGLY